MPSSTPAAGDFLPTRWTIVLAAANSPNAGSHARRALEELAHAYWYPLYAYLRRQGLPPTDAEDLTQSFFANLIEKHALSSVDPAKGRFRAFLLASLKHFLSHHREHARAQKRSPHGRQIISLDTHNAESLYSHEAVGGAGGSSDTMTPEKLFERRWALAVLDRVLVRLEADYAARHESPIFQALKGVLTTSTDAPSYAALAPSLNTTEGALKTAAHRLRRRYRDILRDEISHTVSSPAEIDEEINYLLSCL